MSQPTPNGLSIADRIARSRHESAGVAIWYLGQVGFLLQHRGLTIAIDPYLSYAVDNLDGFDSNFWVRNYPPPIDPDQLRHVDLVLCSHDHLDHVDPETLRAIAKASPECLFAGPRISIEEIKKNGIPAERTIILNEGKSFPFKGMIVEPIASSHEDYETDEEGFHRFLGFILRWEGMTIYHAGDTVLTPRLSERLSREAIDVAFLPINGVTEERHKAGIVGNMDAAAAAKLAKDTGMHLVVPTHWDLYPNNGAEVEGFVSALETPDGTGPRLKIFGPGERLVYTRPERPRELAVILGAGKTGRGFLARLLGNSKFDIAFIDTAKELVDLINADGSYSIHFFGGKRAPYRIHGVRAALPGSPEALDWLTRASAVFTAVGEQNVAGLALLLEKALERRRAEKRPKLSLFVCENGATPSAPLEKAFASRGTEIEIAGAAIFCSTIELPGTRLDIQSEPYDELPFDVEKLTMFTPFSWMRATANFPALLKRKIYTYNCFSGCIAYLGAYKGHKWYADAANDSEVAMVLERIAEPLNQAIAKEFKIDLDEQRKFSQAALRKFSDATIRDDIPRNARNVVRKLAANDRLVAPARLIEAGGGSTDALALAMAAALLYRGPDEKPLEEMLAKEPVAAVFGKISGCPADGPLALRVAHYFAQLKSGGSLLKILDS